MTDEINCNFLTHIVKYVGMSLPTKISKRKTPKLWYQANKERVLKRQKIYYENNKDEIAKRNKVYARSYDGYAIRLFNNIKIRLKHDKSYADKKLLFTKDEFLSFLNKSDYPRLHKQWCDSNYTFLFAPSVDRINSYGDYSLDNIQIITVSENAIKANNVDRKTCPFCHRCWATNAPILLDE